MRSTEVGKFRILGHRIGEGEQTSEIACCTRKEDAEMILRALGEDFEGYIKEGGVSWGELQEAVQNFDSGCRIQEKIDKNKLLEFFEKYLPEDTKEEILFEYLSSPKLSEEDIKWLIRNCRYWEAAEDVENFIKGLGKLLTLAPGDESVKKYIEELIT